MRNFVLVLVLFVFVVCCGSNNIYARIQTQKPNPPNIPFTIKWIGSFSSDQDFNKKKSIFSDLLNIILGPKKLKLSKPVAIVSNDPNMLQVLDQGRRSLVRINRSKADFNEAFPFPSLVSICSNKNADLFFTDSQLNKVFVFKKNDRIPVALNDTLILNRPTGIAWSQKEHSLWVVETRAHRITILNSRGKFIKQIGRRGKAEGEFNFPTYIWIDKNGLVYVVDSMNFRVQIFNSNGTFISAFGQPGDASGYLGRPKGIATDSFGNIYVADALFHNVQVFDKSGNFLSYFGGQGQANGEFWMPSGIYINEHDKIFIADSYNARIQMFQVIRKESKGR